MNIVKIFLLIIFLSDIAFASSEKKFSGHFKTRPEFSRMPYRSDNKFTQLNWRNILRPKIFYNFNSIVSFEGAYEFDLYFYKFDRYFDTRRTIREYRIEDKNGPFTEKRNSQHTAYGIDQNLDRFSFNIAGKNVDITIGRQPISFGSGRTINPTDVLAPFNIGTIDTEERYGMDAIRLRKPLGEMGEVDTGIVCGEDCRDKNSAAFLGIRYPIGDWDIQLLGINYKEHYLLGTDWQGSISDAGIWIEIAYNFMNQYADYARAIVGMEYKFINDLATYVEYHFNGAGKNNKAEYAINYLNHPAFGDGGVFLMGRHYLMPGLNYELSALWHFSFSAIFNLNDWSTYITPQIEYNFLEDLYFDLGIIISSGGGGSEFSFYSDTAFFSCRWYF